MNRVFVDGLGAVSPGGWGVAALCETLAHPNPVVAKPVARPGWEKPLWVRRVPAPPTRVSGLDHPRLRRANVLTRYAVAAALEALGGDAPRVQAGELRLGIILCVMAGSVNYSRRFYEETLRDPATASPLIFPETVFNAAASHLASFLNSTAPGYTLVGDDGSFLQGLALAAGWLASGQTDGCVVVGAEESDWIVADALRLFQRRAVHSEGAGALYLRSTTASAPVAELNCITDSFPFTKRLPRIVAARKMRAQLPAERAGELLCLSTQGLSRADAAELAAWNEWRGTRLAPREQMGEAFAASTAWQCVAVCHALQQRDCSAANVSVVGANQQAIGARFVPVL